MARTALAPIVLLLGAGARAAYTEFFFTSELTDWKCPGFINECEPPAICAFDKLLNKHFCCDTGASDAVCWNYATDCDTGATFRCGTGQYSYCCLTDAEKCTQNAGQINMCWATSENPVANANVEILNDTFSSLSSESPSATHYTADSADLAAATATSTPTPSPADTTTSSTSSTPASPIPKSSTASGSVNSPTGASLQSSTPEDSSDGGLSGGAIGGIVGGVVGGFALVAGGIFLLFRRRRSAKTNGKSELDNNPYAQGGYQNVGQGSTTQKYAYEVDAPNVPLEIGANDAPRELEGSRPGA